MELSGEQSQQDHICSQHTRESTWVGESGLHKRAEDPISSWEQSVYDIKVLLLLKPCHYSECKW